MARDVLKLHSVAHFASFGSAVTSTTSTTEYTDARFKFWRYGIFAVDFGTTDVASTDETYTFTLEGRLVGSGAYTTLATITAGAVADTTLTGKMKLVSVDRFYPRMRVTLTVGGTTPSCVYSAWAMATGYNGLSNTPDAGTVITS
jgi:hypothetical protein